MGNAFMLLIALLYLGAAIGYARERNWPMVLVSLCYGTANVSLVWIARKM